MRTYIYVRIYIILVQFTTTEAKLNLPKTNMVVSSLDGDSTLPEKQNRFIQAKEKLRHIEQQLPKYLSHATLKNF
ncbi:hypothetical protein SPOG_04280 [Schizosaccharomyces cryophilus OY26]|uniref:Uncharacterized protein n=1 Tax=Schizosaccharomyces cryophilus (strain OY26 / ATCC MYA-4695 / CBS 11777 / NBRC 106824 / NRRL Y48691) TaxID=653667 RepID=S9VTJ9_SCHCR|nr:uncharacterized protein SPOG_04280 [Schizosaccharomyces cryophilus OY26]EPY49370.1 hypothetical protein SPOG_04280 [Schizosaccharomyces cryophilus OY26]